jgi:hypothetical protein
MTKNEVFKKNPFVAEGFKRVQRNLKNNTEIVANKETGELYELIKVKSLTTVVDTKSYTKVYHQHVNKIKQLSTAGLKLFCYILLHTGIKKDYIHLNINDCLEFAGYNLKSKKSFYLAVVELIDLFIIAESTENNKYWINTNVLYNGNRINEFKEDEDLVNLNEE